VNYGWGLMPTTAAIMAATVAALGFGLALEGRVPILAVITLILVLVLGGASLVFEDEVFIKIKPTVGNSLFATALAPAAILGYTLITRAVAQVYWQETTDETP